MITITDDMRAVVDAAHLCFAATVSPDGRSNLSPKGTIRVWNAHGLSRRGYRFSGRASLHRDDDVFQTATRRVFEKEGSSYAVAAVVLLQIGEARPLVSPGYVHIKDEVSMRRAWALRRAALDREFDAYIASTPPFDPRRGTV